jgi:hypothetical protein
MPLATGIVAKLESMGRVGKKDQTGTADLSAETIAVLTGTKTE